MGEAKRRGIHGGVFGEMAPRLFVKAWCEATSEARVEFADGQLADGTWIIVATVGPFAALLTPDQARATATAFMEALSSGKVPALDDAISDVVVALGAAADEMERLHPVEAEPAVLLGLGG